MILSSSTTFATATNNPLDYALRLCESIAFILHGILGLTEPCSGCLRSTFKDNGAMPIWFLPTAGLFLICVAILNFRGNDIIILINQAYIAAFHMGGVLYHNRLKHHPASGVGPGMFVVLAVVVACMRAPIWMVFGGLILCYSLAVGLTTVLVKLPLVAKSSRGDGVTGERAHLMRVD
jgi:hypothetical protein